jgi:hypothetical protein
MAEYITPHHAIWYLSSMTKSQEGNGAKHCCRQIQNHMAFYPNLGKKKEHLDNVLMMKEATTGVAAVIAEAWSNSLMT